MIRKVAERETIVRSQAKGGKGNFINQLILTEDELRPAARHYSVSILPPGASVGMHVHTGEMEVCYFLFGKGVVIDENGTTPVGPGDVNIVLNGHGHSVENTGDVDLVYTALILMNE